MTQSTDPFADDYFEPSMSLAFRFSLFRWKLKSRLRRAVCRVIGHGEWEEWGGKYWTDYGYEYDGGSRCKRCGEER